MGACGTGQYKETNSGIYRCIWAQESPVIVADTEVTNPQTKSEKCLLLKNNQDTEAIGASESLIPILIGVLVLVTVAVAVMVIVLLKKINKR